MGDHTKIQWCDSTWNCIRGCSKVSAGCTNCYAEAVARRFHAPGLAFEGVATDRGWNGKVKLVEKHLGDPLRWKKPRKIFLNSMSDLFHDSIDFATIDRIFAVMADCPQHTFQILTKRPHLMLEYLAGTMGLWYSGPRERLPARITKLANNKDFKWPLPNVWLGVSVEDQKTVNERVPILLNTPATVRFVSAEPLLGPIDFDNLELLREYARSGITGGVCIDNCIDWIIVGGESGPGARECKIEWIRDIVNQCAQTKTACFVKQLGSKPIDYYNTEPWEPSEEAPYNSWSGPPKDKKGGEINEFPADLRVREFPSIYPILEK